MTIRRLRLRRREAASGAAETETAMALGLLTVLVMAILAYAFWREGPLTAFAMCCNVLVAGLLAFNLFEPIADLLEPAFADNFMAGTEDGLALMLVFWPALMLFRWMTNSLASTHMEYPAVLYRGGAVFFGLVAGYLVSGFLLCAFQTLPFQQDFLGFTPYVRGESSGARRVLPPDLVWLAMMQRLSRGPLSTGGEDGPTVFDKNGNYELRYARYRRLDESGKTRPIKNELTP
jgi:hypothetical protein